MRKNPTTLFVICLPFFVGAPAFAEPATTSKRADQKPAVQKVVRKTSGPNVAGVKRALEELHTDTYKNSAAAMYLVPHHGVREKITQTPSDYNEHKNQSFESVVKQSSLGPTMKAKYSFLGSVSTHNEGELYMNDKASGRTREPKFNSRSTKAFDAFLANRMKADGVQLVQVTPSGKRIVLIDAAHGSEVVHQEDVELDLSEKGRHLLRYERTAGPGGRIVSAQGLYQEWREKGITVE